MNLGCDGPAGSLWSSWENSLSSPGGMLGGLGTVLEVSMFQPSHLGGDHPWVLQGAELPQAFWWLFLSHKTLPTWAARGQLECVRIMAGGCWGAFWLGGAAVMPVCFG